MATKKAAKAIAPKPAKPAIDENAVIAMIADGMTQRNIAQAVGIPKTTLRDWLDAEPDRSARAREAARKAAQAFAEKAEDVIADASDPFALAKAKELAHHYRWAASKADSAKYGEKAQLDVTQKVDISIDQIDAKIAKLIGSVSASA